MNNEQKTNTTTANPFFNDRPTKNDNNRNVTEFERMDAIYRRAAKPDLLQKISELQELVIWMTGCGYDFTQHSYFIEQRNKLVLLEENKDDPDRKS